MDRPKTYVYLEMLQGRRTFYCPDDDTVYQDPQPGPHGLKVWLLSLAFLVICVVFSAKFADPMMQALFALDDTLSKSARTSLAIGVWAAWALICLVWEIKRRRSGGLYKLEKSEKTLTDFYDDLPELRYQYRQEKWGIAGCVFLILLCLVADTYAVSIALFQSTVAAGLYVILSGLGTLRKSEVLKKIRSEGERAAQERAEKARAEWELSGGAPGTEPPSAYPAPGEKGTNLYSYALSLLALALLVLLYFLWQPYPRGIVKAVPWVNADLITGGLHFLLFALTIDLSVRSMAGLRERCGFFTWKNLQYLAAMFALQLVLDLVSYASAMRMEEYAVLVYDVLTAAGWALYALLFYRMTGRGENSGRRGRIMAGLAAAALLLCVLQDIGDIVQRQELIEKYRVGAQMLDSQLKNMQFRCEMRNMLLDLWCGAAFLTVFKLEGQAAAREKERKPGEGRRAKFRMYGLLAAFGIIYFAKVILLPNNAILPGGIERSHSYSEYVTPFAVFDITGEDSFSIYRGREDEGLESVYSVSKDTVWYEGENLFQLRTEGEFSGVSRNEKDRIEYNGLQTVSIANVETAIFASREIVWASRHETAHMQLKELASAKEKPILTGLCLDRIAAGDWRFFEYGYEYLLKVEPEFILPYMERYAAGDFTDSEVKYNSEYRPEYIQKIAMTALERAEA